MPGSPVWLVVQGLGELAVRRGPLREGRGVVDGGADEGMGELQPGPVHLDQAQLLGWRQRPRIRAGAVASGCAQVRAVGHGGQQQRGLRWLGQGGEPGGEDGGQPVSQGQRLGGPPAAGGGIVGDHRGQLDQRHRITGRLGEHLRPGPPAGRARLPVQQEAGVRRGQRLQVQLREAPVKAGGRGLPPGAHQQHHPLGVQAAAGEGQRVQRAAVQPVGVIGDHQDRGPFGQIRQQGQDGHPGQQRVRSTGVRRKAQRPQQRLGLPAGEAGGAGQHRPQQLMQPGEREPGLRFPAGDRQHPHARHRARPAASASSTVLPIPASPVTTRTWLACGTGSTSARSRASPASRPMMGAGCCERSSPGPGICLSSRPVRFVNAVPKLNRDHGPGMPAARKVQSHHGYRSCLPEATVMTGPGVTASSTER